MLVELKNWLQTAASSVVESTPFASSALDAVLWGRYSANKFAKEQLTWEGKFEQSTSAKVVGTWIWLLGWYGIYGKVADATILGNKSPSNKGYLSISECYERKLC